MTIERSREAFCVLTSIEQCCRARSTVLKNNAPSDLPIFPPWCFGVEREKMRELNRGIEQNNGGAAELETCVRSDGGSVLQGALRVAST